MNKLLLVLVVLAALIAGWFYFKDKGNEEPETVNKVTTYEECVAAGYAQGGVSPETCTTPEGEVFTKNTEQSELQWKTINDEKNNLTFRYPPEIGTEYISTVDWPPKLELLQEPFTCTEAGAVIDRAGKTTKEEINGNTYCVTRSDEGAAGSVYSQYAFARELDGQVAIMTFSLRKVQCPNYDEPKKSECEEEQTDFDVNNLIDSIMQTIEFSS